MIYYQIYNIVNQVNGKNYIGKHKVNTNKKDNYFGSGTYLNNAKNKYGIDNFIKYELETVYTEEEANWYEKKYIKFYRLAGKAEYNLCNGGEGNSSIPTNETLQKRSISMKGKNTKPKSEETKNKISITLTGRKLSEKVKSKIGKAGLGRTFTEISKKKMSEAKKGKPQWKNNNHPFLGKHHTDEAKQKNRDKHLGRLKGSHWYNNGEKNIRCFECPNGYSRGKLKRKNKDENII